MKALGYFAVVTGKGKHDFYKDFSRNHLHLKFGALIWNHSHASFVGSANESIDSIKDYEEEYFQSSRLLR